MKRFQLSAFWVCFLSFFSNLATAQEGAWKANDGKLDYAIIAADGYMMLSVFDHKGKQFVKTMGGPFSLNGEALTVKVEFNSNNKSAVGKSETFYVGGSESSFTTTVDGKHLTFNMVDGGQQNLSGNWRITQRRVDGKMGDIPLRSRRTLKLLTGTRFQWAAINIETGEFSGTGGGTYTFKDGKYVENIEYFSRDNNRVGAVLSFDGKLENGKWIHSGLSSTGSPIYEIWSRFK